MENDKDISNIFQNEIKSFDSLSYQFIELSGKNNKENFININENLDEEIDSKNDNNPEEFLFQSFNFNIIYQLPHNKTNSSIIDNDQLYLSLIQQLNSCVCSTNFFFISLINILSNNLNYYISSFSKNKQNSNLSTSSTINEEIINKSILNKKNINNKNKSINNHNTENNLFLSKVLEPDPSKSKSTFFITNTQHSFSFNSTTTSHFNEIFFQYIPFLTNLLTVKDIIQNIFPKKNSFHIYEKQKANMKKRKSSIFSSLNNNNQNNIFFNLFLMYKDYNFTNSYVTSSQIHIICYILEINNQIFDTNRIIKKSRKPENNEINSIITSPTKLNLNIKPAHNISGNSFISLGTFFYNSSLSNNNIHIDKNDEDNYDKKYSSEFLTWLIFCNDCCREVFLNYFVVDVNNYIIERKKKSYFILFILYRNNYVII